MLHKPGKTSTLCPAKLRRQSPKFSLKSKHSGSVLILKQLNLVFLNFISNHSAYTELLRLSSNQGPTWDKISLRLGVEAKNGMLALWVGQASDRLEAPAR
jgi:hypothetical protein